MAISDALQAGGDSFHFERPCVTECANSPITVAAASRDGTSWSAVAPLFPEFVSGKGAAAAVLIGEAPARSDARPTLLPVIEIASGLLQAPRVDREPGWLSGTVSKVIEGEAVLPGWCAAALARTGGGADPDRRRRAGAVLAALRQARVGGTFWAAPAPFEREVALVCLGRGAGFEASLAALGAAFAARQAADIVVLADQAPRAIRALATRRGCLVLTGPHDPWSAIDRAAAIEVAGDPPIGLLALLAGRRPRHHSRVWHEGADPLDTAAAWLAGTRHVDPYAQRPTSCEANIALLGDWRETLAANRGIACCVGMSVWKRRRIGAFFHTGERPPPFRRTASGALRLARRHGGAIAVWNSRIPAGLEAASAAGVKLLRVEDGFIRSIGLGSDFLPPCSIIADAAGIYYDPSRPSDLERLLAETQFDPVLLARAARLIAKVRDGGVTKYGTAASGDADRLLTEPGRTGRRILLVPGQVADDLSVRLGAGAIRTNLALLRQVRADNPSAFVVYKPHPDVDAGHRPGAIPEAELRRLADRVVRGGAMAALIESVDEVHTMTSLAGFEALLRRRTVCVYGQPFYAGWGLTRDLAPISRRGRRLSLEELAACVLILYPKYLDPVTSLPCGPELLIERLAAPQLWRPGWLMRARQMQGALRKRLGSRGLTFERLGFGTDRPEIDVADPG